jgi:hypothetical protein
MKTKPKGTTMYIKFEETNYLEPSALEAWRPVSAFFLDISRSII